MTGVKAVQKRRTAGRPAMITRDDMLEASKGIRLADLTLKAVAERLQVTAQALYRYVKDRDDLVGLVADRATHLIPIPPDMGEDWPVWAYGFAHSIRDLYESVPGLAEFSIGRTAPVPPVISRYERSISIAVRSGFDPVAALWATRAVTEFVHAWVAGEELREKFSETSGRTEVQELLDSAQELGARSAAEAFARSLHQPKHLRFEFSLKALLTGLSGARSSGISF